MLLRSLCFGVYFLDIRGHKMRVINYWDQFLSTGKIADYLAYREEEGSAVKEDKGAEQGAGTDQCYRDDFKSGACRGI